MSELGRALIAALDSDDLATLADRLGVGLTPAEPDRLLTCEQAALVASVHVETIRRARRSGALRTAGTVGRRPRIALADLEEWVRGTASQPNAAPAASRRRPSASRRPLGTALARINGDAKAA